MPQPVSNPVDFSTRGPAGLPDNPGPAENLKVNQTIDTDLIALTHSMYRARYMYRRSSDSRELESIGQDYIALRHTDSRFAFCVCDGVGQSYMGNLAAQFLGDYIVDWLWQVADNLTTERNLASEMARYLDELKNSANETIQVHPISLSLPPLTISALEELRAEGSASTFACGFLMSPGGQQPKGVLVLAWVGDSFIDVRKKDGTAWGRIPADAFKTGEHWSTRDGIGKLEPHCIVGEWSELEHIVVYSDGLNPVCNRLGSKLADDELKKLILETSRARNSDDISFLDITLGTMSEAPKKLEIPRVLGMELALNRIGLEWEGVPGAQYYDIELCVNDRPLPAPQSPVREGTYWSYPVPFGGGRFRVRVRARCSELESEWSPPHTFTLSSRGWLPSWARKILRRPGSKRN